MKGKRAGERKRKTQSRERLRASMTLEAALCLPVFLFAAVMLLSPLKLMDQKRQLQNVMEAAAKDMAIFYYTERLVSEKGSGFLNRSEADTEGVLGGGAPEEGGGAAGAAAEGIMAARVLASLDPAMIQNARFTNCGIAENDLIKMELHYEFRLPFRIFGVEYIAQSAVVNRRAWTGSEGGRGKDRYGAAGDAYDRDEEGDRIVYVGKTSTVYHINRNCHYLSNIMKQVDGATVEELRNASGGKYHACESCRPDQSGSVYILESGSAYHKSESCKALASYARAVKLREAEHLGACSYCSGGKKTHG